MPNCILKNPNILQYEKHEVGNTANIAMIFFAYVQYKNGDLFIKNSDRKILLGEYIVKDDAKQTCHILSEQQFNWAYKPLNV